MQCNAMQCMWFLVRVWVCRWMDESCISVRLSNESSETSQPTIRGKDITMHFKVFGNWQGTSQKENGFESEMMHALLTKNKSKRNEEDREIDRLKHCDFHAYARSFSSVSQFWRFICKLYVLLWICSKMKRWQWHQSEYHCSTTFNVSILFVFARHHPNDILKLQSGTQSVRFAILFALFALIDLSHAPLYTFLWFWSPFFMSNHKERKRLEIRADAFYWCWFYTCAFFSSSTNINNGLRNKKWLRGSFCASVRWPVSIAKSTCACLLFTLEQLVWEAGHTENVCTHILNRVLGILSF